MRLRDLREDRDLTQQQIAELLGTSFQYYQKYESGIFPIPVDRLEILADFYETSTGDKLRDLRNERNLSQAQLAKRIGVTSSTIALYETGERLPSLPRLIALSRSFGVTTDYLLGVSRQKDCFLDVVGLTQKQIESLEAIIENYREQF